MHSLESVHISPFEEEMLMRSFKKGDHTSFRQIHERLNRPLTFFVENITYSRIDAEDIVASAFCKLFYNRAKLKSLEHIHRWMYIIAKNEAIDYLRAKTKKREVNSTIAYLAQESEELMMETERAKAILLNSIIEEVEKLPKQRKTIFKLYFFEQKQTWEIAEKLGLNSQTVLNHKAKAVETLQKTFKSLKWLWFLQ